MQHVSLSLYLGVLVHKEILFSIALNVVQELAARNVSHIPIQSSLRKAVIFLFHSSLATWSPDTRVKGMSKITSSFIHMIFILDAIIKANHKSGGNGIIWHILWNEIYDANRIEEILWHMRVISLSSTSVFAYDLHRVSLINLFLRKKKEGDKLSPPKDSLRQNCI